MLTEKEYETFFTLLNRIVNDTGGSWKDHKQAILANADSDDKVNLAEFASWGWDWEC